MTVVVMNIGIMRMAVYQWFMDVKVRVWLRAIPGEIMCVPVMHIVHMRMRMRLRFMPMQMLVLFDPKETVELTVQSSQADSRDS
jgi:hypothetical protein